MKMPKIFQGKKDTPSSSKKTTNPNATRAGLYSLVITVIVLGILIMVNVLANVIPSSLTSYDISAVQLYSVTGNTRVVISALDQDVTIYWIVQDQQEDSVIENLLTRYEELSDHITVVKRNPDEYPTFAAEYTDEDVTNNSLVVECEDKNRYIAYSDIYTTEANYVTGQYESSFDGEGQITSAIDYVTKEDMPIVYTLEGHGEGELPEALSNEITKANYEVQSFSLLTENGVPEDAACVIIYAPESDISEEEASMLKEYVSDGGKLFVSCGPTEDGILTNLCSILSDYGVETQEGIVVEEDPMHYGFAVPYILLPDMQSDDITDPLMENNYYVLIPVASGLTINEDSGTTVQSLMDTTDTSYSKIDGFTATDLTKEDGDIDGPFSLAVSVTTENDGQIIWIASSMYLSEPYNGYSSGANTDLTMNALTKLVGETEVMSIRTRSLNYNTLTLTAAQSNMLRLVMVVIIPLVFVVLGVIVVLRRRSLRK